MSHTSEEACLDCRQTRDEDENTISFLSLSSSQSLYCVGYHCYIFGAYLQQAHRRLSVDYRAHATTVAKYACS